MLNLRLGCVVGDKLWGWWLGSETIAGPRRPPITLKVPFASLIDRFAFHTPVGERFL